MAIGLAIVIAITVVKLGVFRLDRSLAGAVLTANADPKKQLPLPNVEITAEAGGTTVRTKSDASGFFQMKWRPAVWPGEQVTFRFRHPDHQPLEITRPLDDQLYIARMTSSACRQGSGVARRGGLHWQYSRAVRREDYHHYQYRE